MRILQVIDSFDVGGAEKMAINYANALAEKIEFSGIVATRKEGELKSQISPKVSSYFLKINPVERKILLMKFFTHHMTLFIDVFTLELTYI